MLEAAAGDLGRAVAVGAEHERDVHVAALRAGLTGVDDGVVLGRDGGVHGHGVRGVGRDGHACVADEHLTADERAGLDRAAVEREGGLAAHCAVREQGAAVAGKILCVEDLCLRALDEAAALDLADLALVHVLGVHVLVRRQPLRVVHEVIGHVGVDDDRERAVDAAAVGVFERAHGAADAVDGQVVVVGRICIAALQQVARGHGLVGVLHVVAADEHLARDRVERAAGLRAEQLRGHGEIVVDGGQQQQVAHLDVAAVLAHGRLDGGHAQALAVGGHALGQGGQRLTERGKAAELDRLAAVCGDGVLLRELVVHELGLGRVDEVVRVERLHLLGQALLGGHLRVCVKQAQVHADVFHTHVSFFLCCPLPGTAPGQRPVAALPWVRSPARGRGRCPPQRGRGRQR